LEEIKNIDQAKNLKTNSTKKIIIIGFIAVLIIGGGYFLANKFLFKKEEALNYQPAQDSTKLAFDKEGMINDPFSDLNGPFYHKVYKATSKDGIKFTKTNELIMDKASVPDVVKLNDGTLFIYAVDGAQRSNSGLMVARSKDDGKTWEQGSLQVKTERTKYSIGADPQAVLLDDGKIRLYYLVFSDTKPPMDETGKPIPTGEKQKIKSALSTDGINFTEEEGSRYEMTEIWTDPDVIKIGSKWFMYLSEGSKNMALTSTDGMSFTLEKAIRTDGAISKTIKTDDNKYRQFYCKNGISSAVTTDGFIFTNEVVSLESASNEILCDPTPVKVDNKWLMFYKAAQPRQDGGQKPLQ